MSRTNEWFVPNDGIAREVITTDIEGYLGPDALIRPGSGTDEYQDQPRYWIRAYRTLTSHMILGLNADTQWWLQERPRALASETNTTIPQLATEPSSNDIAESCGWQLGSDKFLWSEGVSTPPTITGRGTLGKGGFGIVEEVTLLTGPILVQKRIHIPRRKESAKRYWDMIRHKVENLKSLSHKHIVKTIGYYSEIKGLYDIQFCMLMWPSGDEDLGIFLEELYPNASWADKESTYNN